MKVSAAIITKDAAAHLERCLASLAFADEIVVVDQDSRDGTLEICRRHGALVHQSEWLGFGPTKQKAVDLCRNPWILSVDADEEVDERLRRAIVDLPDSPPCAAYRLNRLSRFLGRWIKHCGWHPERIVRLFDRRAAAFDGNAVHESVRVTGPVGRLPGLLLHHSYDTMELYVQKLDRYTTLSARQLHASGKRVRPLSAVIRGKATFLRMYLLQGGFLDGWQGLVLCLGSGYSVMVKYIKLWRLGRP